MERKRKGYENNKGVGGGTTPWLTAANTNGRERTPPEKAQKGEERGSNKWGMIILDKWSEKDRVENEMDEEQRRRTTQMESQYFVIAMQ